ncbi:3-dehydroquinate synthase [Priestia endophytica]|uniref:3-dehydroquinate synthase n=1 Tax=Priestia endophytica TaxID=135735 RepID=UPI00203F1544|nr:3-dehydroquinate synthase [Priestia endophytica]MCM3539411.1 3-dehydroquinate synthase [Priestia endophytica]
MKSLQIKTASKKYPVYFGERILENLHSVIEDVCPSVSNILVISDETVYKHHGKALMKELPNQALSYILPSGEGAKSFEHFYNVQTFALEHGLDRQSLIIAFGGGVVGDLAGFVAATYMRGIPFIQVPTTLLAHDSAVGGKVAINHELGKNMIGAFHQPEAVFYDISLLETLSEKEWRSGFAEVVKHALIYSTTFYDWLKSSVSTFEDLKGETLIQSIKEGIKVKAEIVANDEKETGIRAFLNFGHTLGHAIEAELGYGEITHGEAVVIGMCFAFEIGKELIDTTFPLEELKEWLHKLGYRTDIPQGLDKNNLVAKMKADKKAQHGQINMVLLKEIGEPLLMKVDEKTILSLLSETSK